jgi:hypothetical protein
MKKWKTAYKKIKWKTTSIFLKLIKDRKKMEDVKKWTTTSRKNRKNEPINQIDLIGCDTIVNSPSSLNYGFI